MRDFEIIFRLDIISKTLHQTLLNFVSCLNPNKVHIVVVCQTECCKLSRSKYDTNEMINKISDNACNVETQIKCTIFKQRKIP